MFCSQCGKKLSDDARFCTTCGQPIGTAAIQTGPSVNAGAAAPQMPYPGQPAPMYQAQPPAQAAGEQAVLVLHVNRKFSMLKMTPCYMVFMTDKIILAYLSKERQKAESDRVSQEIKASGQGFFKGSAAMMNYWADYHKRYYQMSSQQIMSEDPDNMLIYNQSVSRLLFHAYDTDYSSDGTQNTSGGKLSISLASGETLKFSHSIGQKTSIRDALAMLFGDRFKYRR
jgi:hypothetical protein